MEEEINYRANNFQCWSTASAYLDELWSDFTNYNQRRNNKMTDYIELYYNFKDTALKGKLKPVSCPSCKTDGFSYSGTCKTCLENQAYNREYMETHSFIMDKGFRSYHDDYHNIFKGLILRLPNEHPYLYYGIEVEVDFDSSYVCIDGDPCYDDENDFSRIQEILNRFSEITEGLFVYEHDSSLPNGVELISRPTSYAYWTHKDTVERLKKGFEFLRERGAYYTQPTTNGQHIHISRKFFDNGDTKLENRQTAYESFDWLFQKFQPEIEKLGGREYTQYCEAKADKLRKSLTDDNWAFQSYPVEAQIKCKLKKGGRLPEGDHYSAVNLTRRTIEARVFRSTTDYKQILANIELVRNFAHAVREENIERSLNDLLHTKENLYLDEHIRKVKMNCRKNKEEFDLDRVNDNEIEITIDKEYNR